MKRQVDEAEEEIERLDGLRKKAQRELEEQHEVNEQLQARIKALEKDSWYGLFFCPCPCPIGTEEQEGDERSWLIFTKRKMLGAARCGFGGCSPSRASSEGG